MQHRKIEVVLEAQQPIAHHEGTLGNQAILMRESIRQPDGTFAQVPIITGDTMRHGLREAAAYAYLDAAGLLSESLSEEALRLLFAGGMVTGTAGGSVKLGDYRDMCDLFPPLALLGGCAQNRVVPGRLQSDEALLICRETEHVLPEWVRAEFVADATARAHVEEVTRVRMDPTLDPAKRTMLTDESRQLIESRLGISEASSEVGDWSGKVDAKSSMLPRSHERVKRGSLWFWRVTATTLSDLEHDTLMVMLATFLADARVGGKKATGHGLVRAIAARNVDVRRPSERTESIECTDLGARVGELFRAHVMGHREAAAQFLRTVAA